VTTKYYYISLLADFYIEVHTKQLLFHTPTTTDMSYSTSSLLTFSSTNVEKDRNREIFDKTIQARQQNLTEILPTYTEETNAKIYVYEVKTLVENSGLGHHQGLVIAALMKAMPMNTRLGKRLRAALNEVKKAFQREHIGPGGAPTSWDDNDRAKRYVRAAFKSLLDTADEDEETVKDLKVRWKALTMQEAESVHEYFDRAMDLLLLLKEKGVDYGHDDQVLDVLGGLRSRTDRIDSTFEKLPIRATDRVMMEESTREVTTVTEPPEEGEVTAEEEPKAGELPCHKCTEEGKDSAAYHSYAFCFTNPLSQYTLRSKVKRGKGDGQRPSSKRSKIKCYTCGELGHISKNCPNAKKQGEGDAISRVELKNSILQEIAEERKMEAAQNKRMMEMIRAVMHEGKGTASGSGTPWSS
jgi:hypothetical protein